MIWDTMILYQAEVPNPGWTSRGKETTRLATKVALARSDGEKWRVRNERKRLLQQHSAIIARRNWEITQRNAWPRMGGVAPRAPPVERPVVHRRVGRRGRRGANHKCVLVATVLSHFAYQQM